MGLSNRVRCRCLRHFAIYSLPWPARLLSHLPPGTVLPEVDRDNVKKHVSEKISSHAAAAASRKSATEEPSTKKKMMAPPPASPPRPPSPPVSESPHHKVEVPVKAKEMLVVPKRPRGRPRKHPRPEDLPPQPKRPRGRPRTRPLPVPVVQEPVAIVGRESISAPGWLKTFVMEMEERQQPRDANGRFGRKSLANNLHARRDYQPFSSLTREERIANRERNKAGGGMGPPPLPLPLPLPAAEEYRDEEGLHRRFKQEEEDVDMGVPEDLDDAMDEDDGREPPSKRLRMSDGSDEEDDSISAPSRFRGWGGSLSYRPNPNSYARRKRFPRQSESELEYQEDDDDEEVEEEEEEEEEEEDDRRDTEAGESPGTSTDETPPPVTPPEDPVTVSALRNVVYSHQESTVAAEDEDEPLLGRPSPLMTSVLTLKPSPVNFAKKRWSSTIAADMAVKNGVGSRLNNGKSQLLQLSRNSSETSASSQHGYEGELGGEKGGHDGYIDFGGEDEMAVDAALHSKSEKRVDDGDADDGSGLEPRSYVRALVGLGGTLVTTSKDINVDVNVVETAASMSMSMSIKSPVSKYLRKTRSFCAVDDESVQPALVNAGWESGSDGSADDV
ncbi:hypothetical protein CONPUDRAFT_163797 [Coniophora puteana RWD-64-598 SS2]|uniref:Uncharacterized protein n=1 Tax=Coniophora puteana (strain RWD-64-598) TaxID=741705 RepID=A0A5M3MU79_CONPW|nr:uncharacterized protein CONPUDRAFT_163797 [Coniophora puteana RWD-64-598 SS2]EIW82718.1 hypothetical protein CONPUDRAFT_163797 [Coniophora puteana RWD-64-598 SS2]